MTAASLLDATLAVHTWGIPGPAFLAGYLALVVVAVALVFRAPARLDASKGEAVDGLRAVDLAFLHDADRLTVTSALASLRTAELLDDDARPTPPGHRGAAVPGDPVQAAVLTALRGTADRPEARRLSTLMARAPVYRAVRDVERGLRDRGLLRTPAEHSAARRWALPLWVVVALGIARIAAAAVDREPYGWLLLVTGLAAIVALGTSIVGAAAPNAAAAATLERAREAHRDLRSDLRPVAPDFRQPDVGLAVALFGWHALTAAMSPLASAVVAIEVFNPSTGETSSAG